MKKNTLIFTLTLFLYTTLFMLFCGDEPYNPLDTTDKNYKPMTLDIMTDSSAVGDTIKITTDVTLELGITSDFLDRIDSIRIDYDMNSISDEPVIIKRTDLNISSGSNKIDLKNPHLFAAPGTYKIEVYAFTKNNQDTSSVITVMVGGVMPRITAQPESQSIAETATATFSVSVKGTKNFSYSWFFTADTSKEGLLLNGQDTLDSTYTDEFVEMTDSGFFYCVVKNDYGKVTSRYAQLKVTPQVLDANAPTVFFEKDSSSGQESVNAEIVLKLSAPCDKEVLVRVLALTSSSAQADSDYQISSNTVVIPARSTSANLRINIVDDADGEGQELIGLQISSARNANIGKPATHFYTISDDDMADSTWPVLYFSQSSGSGIEGENAIIELGLSLNTPKWEHLVSVKCRVLSSLSASPNDYKLLDTMITFSVNETKRYISLQTIKDGISENDEVVEIQLSSPVKAVLSKTKPTKYAYTIKDGDVCNVYFASMEMGSTEKDTTNFADSIPVKLSKPSINEVTVKYEIVTDSLLATAINQGTDYLLPGGEYVRFAPGVQTAYIPVSIIGDTLKEGEEIFAIKLTSPTGGAVIQNADPLKYIISDNESVSLSFKTSQITVQENVGDISIPVSLSKASSDTVRVDYRLAGSALGTDADYILKNDNQHTLVFAPMEREKNIEISIIDDIYDEPDKTFSIVLENPRGDASIGIIDEHTVTVVDNDIPYFSFASAASVVSENAGKVQIPVKLSNPSRVPLRVRYTVSSSSSATSGKDFTAFTTDTAVFNAGDSLFNIELVLTDDNIDEDDENVILTLSALDSSTSPGSVTATTVTINDNDGAASIAFAQDTVTVDEADDTLLLPIVVSGQLEKTASTGCQVSYRTTNCDSNDFSFDETKRIALNVVDNRFASIIIKDDKLFNENDTFYITLFNPQNAELGAIKTCRVAIRDNDYKVTLQSASPNGTVTPSGEQSVTRGKPLQISATANPHYHFTGWTVSNGINIEDASIIATKINVSSTGGTVTANFAIDSFNVVISAENGTVTPNGSVKAAWNDVLSPVPTAKVGYNFKSWSVTADSIEPIGELNITTKFRVKGNGIIKAMHSNTAYSVSVVSSNALFGTVTPTVQQDKNYEETFEIKAQPVANAKFVQWKADSDSLLKCIGDTLAATATVTVRKTGTITAVFAPDSFTLTLASGNSTMGSVDPTSKRMTYFDSCLITATASTGYSFTGWTVTTGLDKVMITNPTAAQTRAKKLSDAATITGSFVPISYSVNTSVLPVLLPLAGTAACDPATSPLAFNTPLKLTATPSDGWKFDHWTGVPASQERNNPANFTVATINSYTAVFVPLQFTLSFEGTTGGEATVPTQPINNITYGVKTYFNATVAIATQYQQQYEFKGTWINATTGDVTINKDTVILKSDATIKPVLVKRQYQLTIANPTAGGTISSSPAAGMVEYGKSVSLALTNLPTGWQFANWTATPSPNPTGPENAGVATITAATTYSAVLARKSYKVTLAQPNPAIGGSTNPSAQQFEKLYQEQITITATPNIGYKFDSWTVDGTIAGITPTLTVVFDKDKSVVANFSEIPGQSGVIYVRKGAPLPGTGTNWANAFPDLETAFNAGGTNKSYWVSGGEYRVSDSANVAAYFTIPDGAKLYGGFTGVETSLNQRIWYDHPSIIQGGCGGAGGNPQNYLFRMDGSNNRINGFVFERTVNTCILIRSAANMDTIENCILRNNVVNASLAFKAISIAGTNTVVNSCVFYNNGSATGATSDGHGIHIVSTGTSTKITNCLLTGNRGPAISNGTTNTTLQTQIINCTIANNATATPEQAPGGISVVGAAIALRGCILWGNTTNRTNGTQIDSAGEIKFCCIQGGIPGGILRQPATSTYDFNTYNSPAFNHPTIPTNIADWYSSSDAVIPFLQSSVDVINKASFTSAAGKPDYDLRSRRRSTPNFDIGAYETLDP